MGLNSKNIVVIGAGFGGITLVLRLAKKIGRLKKNHKIVLIDKRHHQLYTPALYEIASIPREITPDSNLKTSVLIPLKDVTAGKDIEFLCDELVGIKKADKKVILKNSGELEYEYLVLALGSETNYFNIPGLKEYSMPLKTFDDGARLKNAVESGFLNKSPNLPAGYSGKWRNELGVRIAVGGAGSNGVELIAEFVNFVCTLHKDIFKNKICAARFTLIESTPEILPGFDKKTIEKIKKRINKLGVEIKTSSPITSVTSQEIIFKDGKKEPYDILVWTGGVKGPSLFEKLGFPLSSLGSLEVDENLRVKGEDKIFAIGDNSYFINRETKKPLPWNVPVAEAEGRIAAKNILRSIRAKRLKIYRPMKKYPFILTVGRKYAIADLIFLRLVGLSGWILKQLVELRYLFFILPPRKALKIWLIGMKYFTSND